MIVVFGLLATGLFIALTIRTGSARRWGRYIAAAFLSATAGFIAGFIWFETVECTAYSTECDLGPFFGIIWAIAAAVGCLVVCAVIEVVIAGRGAREPDQYDEPSA